jgi:trehalose 6-phosphate phosphatase
MPERLSDCLPEIESVLRAAGRVWVGTDFDGTLAPITDDPDEASLPPAARDALAGLAGHPRAAVGIVSGRDVANLRRHVRLEDIGYAGNHGLEIELPGERFEYPTAAAARPVLARVTAGLGEVLRPYPGAWVQDKGLSLTVHYRRAAAAHHAAVTAAVQAAFDAATAGPGHHLTAPRLVLRPGVLAWDVRPVVDWHKGSAAGWLLAKQAGGGAVPVFLGDDFSDEDAFAAVRAGVTVLVGPDRASNAKYRVDGPADVRAFLEWVRRVLDRATPKG